MAKTVRFYDATLTEGLWEQGVPLEPERREALAQALVENGMDFVEIHISRAHGNEVTGFTALRPFPTKHTRWTAHIVMNASPDQDEALIRQALAVDVPVVMVSTNVQGPGDPEARRRRMVHVASQLRRAGRDVLFRLMDFFRAYRERPDQVWATLDALWEAAQPAFTLGDARGETLPWEVAEATYAVRKRFPQATVGFWMANHNACADDNAMSAVEQGASLVHGTLHGYGLGQGFTDLACIGTALWRAHRRPVTPRHLESLWDWSETLHRWLYAPEEQAA